MEGAVVSGSREGTVRVELNHLLESAAFRSSKRCSDFLKYAVEHTISGPSGALKERSIGVALFQLPPDFDAGQHAVVRVTANDVRKRLAQYYLAESDSYHPVRIELPPGSYSAEFRWQLPASETHVPARPSRLTRPVIACVAVALVMVGAYFLWRWYAVKPISREAKSTPVPALAASASLGSQDVRMIVGPANPYTDRSGRIWSPDRFYSGGTALVRPSEKIFRTLDPDIYRHVRTGDFRYDIPLKPGNYELHLHFAETALADSMSAESSGEGQRIFRVTANGKPILERFDVVSDANGANVADERVFRNISPAGDGFLHLSFLSAKGTAIVSGIEVLAVSPGQVSPVRIRAGWPSSWRDRAGQQWLADSHFLGGNSLVRDKNPVQENYSTLPDMELYCSERWGHFSYAVPVAEGRYRVTLRFCEGHYGGRNTGIGGVGSRVFDVYCNGVALLREFDIVKEAGGEGRPLNRTFSGIRPTAQGKIVFSFVPIMGMASVNAIEVVEDLK